MAPQFEVSTYAAEPEKVETSEDCDHGPCVGIVVDHGGGPMMIWVYTNTMEQRDELASVLSTNMSGLVQLIDDAS